MSSYNPPLNKESYYHLTKVERRAFAKWLKAKGVPHHKKEPKSMESAWKALRKYVEQSNKAAEPKPTPKKRIALGHEEQNLRSISPKHVKNSFFSILWIRVKKLLKWEK